MEYTTLNNLNDASSQKIVINRIKRIIEKYADVWRVLHEPIQNSIDAIQKRSDVLEGQVYVEINVKRGKVKIHDNGKGFPRNLELLLPDGTDKNEQLDTMGYQGVGLKSVIYSSNNFRLQANTGNGQFWGLEIANASKYLETEGQQEAPITEIEQDRGDQGTTIEIDFKEDIVVKAIEQIIDAVTTTESNFKWRWDDVCRTNYFLSKAKNKREIFVYIFKYYLLTHTYIGSLSRLLNCRLKQSEDIYAKKVTVHLKIDLENLNKNDTENEFFKQVITESIADKSSDSKLLKFEVDNKFLDFQGIVESIKKIAPRDITFDIFEFDIRRAGIMRDPTLVDQVYCNIMTPDYTKDESDIESRYTQYISLISPSNDARKEENIKQFKSLFPKILGIYILIGRMEYFEKYLGNNYGMKLIAANGIPTQHELTARSSNQSFYFNPITFIMNVDGKLNEGKTHLVNDYLKKRCVEFFREAFESTLNRLTKEFVRTVPNTDPPTETDIVSLRNINIKGIDIKREPVDENTLIALFYQMLKVKNLSLPTYGLLGQGVFDGKFVYEDRNIRSDNDLLKLEFKVKLSKLLDEFDSPNSAKGFDQCDLLIVWSDRISTTQQQDWRVVNRSGVPTASLNRSRCPDWITTLVKDKDQVYKPIIILSDWVDELDENFASQDV